MNKLHLGYLNNTKVKSSDEKAVVFEGFANFSEKDIVNERLDPLSVKLERYKQNPILLFNHDIDTVLGRVTKVEPRDEGLWVQAEIKKRQHPDHALIREFIEDGTLKTFSVRFDNEDREPDPKNPSGTLIKNWELMEISVVSVPAQPESTFSIANAKAAWKKQKENKMKLKTMINNAKSKGAAFAEKVGERMQELASDQEIPVDQIIDNVAQKCGKTIAEIRDILQGEVTPVPGACIDAMADELQLDENMLKQLNEQDIENLENKGSEEDKKTEESKESDEGEKSESAKQDEDESGLSPDVQECVREKIPTLRDEGMSQEQAVAAAISMCSQEKGCKMPKFTPELQKQFMDEDKGDNTDKAEDDDPASILSPELRDCVQVQIPRLMEEGLEEEEAIATAVRMCSEEKGCEMPELDEEMTKELLDIASGKSKASTTKQDDPHSGEAIEQETQSTNANLEMMKQTNVLLGALVERMDSIKEVLVDLVNRMDVKTDVENEDDKMNMDDVNDEMKRQYETKIEEMNKELAKIENMLQSN